jgi:hypothetical protein
MMDMIEILYNQYHTKTKLYVTWDAVAWHNSGPFLEALDQFNEETRALSAGPIIELVLANRPKPTIATGPRFPNSITMSVTATKMEIRRTQLPCFTVPLMNGSLR